MNILGKTQISYQTAKDWAKTKGATQVFQDNAKLYWNYCSKVGVDPSVAYIQYGLETGWGKFGGVLNESFHNPCGLKVPKGGGDYDANAHKRFASWNEGIQAHVDHLALYAGAAGYPKTGSPDPRHFPYLLGTAKTIDSLLGKWATDPNYVTKLSSLCKDLAMYHIKTNSRDRHYL